MEQTVITQQQFAAFNQVRASGATNMLDVNAVSVLSFGVLDKAAIRFILRNYSELTKQFG